MDVLLAVDFTGLVSELSNHSWYKCGSI